MPLSDEVIHHNQRRRRYSGAQEDTRYDKGADHDIGCSVSVTEAIVPPRASPAPRYLLVAVFEKFADSERNPLTDHTITYRQVRDTPSPGFNTADNDRSHVQPLVNARGPEMDESYVMTHARIIGPRLELVADQKF